MYHGWEIHILKQFSGFAFPEISSGLTEQRSFPVDCSRIEKVCDWKRSTTWDKTKYSLQIISANFSSIWFFLPKLDTTDWFTFLKFSPKILVVLLLISSHILWLIKIGWSYTVLNSTELKKRIYALDTCWIKLQIGYQCWACFARQKYTEWVPKIPYFRPHALTYKNWLTIYSCN